MYDLCAGKPPIKYCIWRLLMFFFILLVFCLYLIIKCIEYKESIEKLILQIKELKETNKAIDDENECG